MISKDKLKWKLPKAEVATIKLGNAIKIFARKIASCHLWLALRITGHLVKIYSTV
jgi:hypothetical protein